MRRSPAAWIPTAIFLVLAGLVFLASAQVVQVKLNNGQTLRGEPLAPTPEGVLLKLDATKFSERIAWTNMTEATLRELSQNPKLKSFVTPLIYDEPDIPESSRRRQEAQPTSVTRLERPMPGGSVSVLFGSPLALFLWGLLYATMVFAGYVVGVYRNYHRVMSAGLAAALPVLGPIILLCLPNRGSAIHHPAEAEEATETTETTHEEGATAEAGAPEAGEAHPGAPAAATGLPPSTVYARGQTTFNRRFFETKLAGFLRVVPSEAEKDMILCIEALGEKYVTQRVARIMPNEVYLQVTKAGASSEVIIPFSEIKTVTVRHKDAAS